MLCSRFIPLWLAIIVTAAAAVPPTDPAASKPVPISSAITVLRMEARQSWAKDQTLPRSEPTFALEKHWTVPFAAVIQALGRRLDNNPVIDAYIKWQLLSFDPPIVKATGEPLRRLIASLPAPVAQPSINTDQLNQRHGAGAGMSFGKQMAYVRGIQTAVGPGVAVEAPQIGVISEGGGFGDEPPTREQLYAVTKQINAHLAAARRTIAAANAVIQRCRAAVIDRLPDDPAVRLRVLYKDLADRLHAGDPGCPDALTRAAAATKTAVEKHQLTNDDRNALLQTIAELAKMRTPVTDGVELDGRTIRAVGRTLILSPQELQSLANTLGARLEFKK